MPAERSGDHPDLPSTRTNTGSTGLRTWTQRFTAASVGSFAGSLLALTGGQFTGASARTARATTGLLGIGVAVQSVGVALRYEPVRAIGILGSVAGAIGCGYLLGRRFANE